MISQIDHEANISSWVRLARLQDHTVKWWRPTNDDEDMMLTPENLRPLLTQKTRFVAMTHASNVLGGIHDVKAIADLVHKKVRQATLEYGGAVTGDIRTLRTAQPPNSCSENTREA